MSHSLNPFWPYCFFSYFLSRFFPALGSEPRSIEWLFIFWSSGGGGGASSRWLLAISWPVASISWRFAFARCGRLALTRRSPSLSVSLFPSSLSLARPLAYSRYRFRSRESALKKSSKMLRQCLVAVLLTMAGVNGKCACLARRPTNRSI